MADPTHIGATAPGTALPTSADANTAILATYRDYQASMEKAAKAIVLLTPDDLLPNARVVYDKKIEELGVAALPIILDRNIDSDSTAVDTQPTSNLNVLNPAADSVPSFMVVGEYSHRWNVEDARQNSDSAESMATLKPITDVRIVTANAELSKHYGVNPAPALYYSSDTTSTTDYAGRTREGTPYIVLKADDTVEQQLTTLLHELGHHALGHVSFEGMVRTHNRQSQEATRMQEAAADMYYVYTCRADNAIADFAKNLEDAKQEAQTKGEEFTPEYEQEQDPTHPLLEERMTLIGLEDKHLRAIGGCKVPFEVLAGLKTLDGGQQHADVEQASAASVGSKPVPPAQR